MLFPSRRAGLSDSYPKTPVKTTTKTPKSFHPGERDCLIPTVKSKRFSENDFKFPSRRAGLSDSYGEQKPLFFGKIWNVSIPASGIV